MRRPSAVALDHGASRDRLPAQGPPVHDFGGAGSPADETSIRADERRRVAQHLHDELGQLLTALKLELAAAVSLFGRPPLPQAAGVIDRLQAAIGLVEVSIGTVQRLSLRLHRESAGPFGDRLRHEVSLFAQRTGICCRLTLTPSRPRLDPEEASVLHRIAGEALTNVARHAHASAVDVSLVKRRGTLTLSIADNGRGLTPADAGSADALGLQGMRELVRTCGGDLRIGPRPGGGTTVTARIPAARPDTRRRRSGCA